MARSVHSVDAPSTSRSMYRRARAVIPGGVNSGQRQIPGLEDLVIVATSGATFTDDSGQTYTDYHAAFGPAILGYNDAYVDAAATRVASSLGLTGVGVTPIEIELAERIVSLVPGVEMVLLTVTGSEATYHALRLARAATGRRYVVKFQGCYHGWHDSVALNVISQPDRVGSKDPLSAGSLPEVVDLTLVLPFNDLDAVATVFAQHPADIAAVIVEPIPHNIGSVLPQEGFLEGLRAITRQYEAVLIFDEVITGFRHGLGGYQGMSGITPDLTAFGKAMANGYPIGALGGRADLMELFSTTPGNPVFFAGTYNGHPATAAAALATLERLEAEPVHEHIFALGERARVGLRDAYADLPVSTYVTGFGSVFVTYFLDPPVKEYRDLLRNDAELFVNYRKALMADGIFELPLNLKRSHVSYAHTSEDVDALIEASARSVRHLVAM